MHGFFICENKAGATVMVENVGTGRKLKVFDNGIGGLAADLHDGHYYKVAVQNETCLCSWYLVVNDGQISDPINLILEAVTTAQVEESTLADLCAFRPLCKNFAAPGSDLCQNCLDAIAFEEQAERDDDQQYREEEEDESEPIIFASKPDMWEVQVTTSAHIALLKRMSVKWLATERNPQGAPAISLDRPYGNCDYQGDIAEVFAVNEEDAAANRYIAYVHRGMQQILQIAVEHVDAGLRPGVYRSDLNNSIHTWEYVDDVHGLPYWQAELQQHQAVIRHDGTEVAYVSAYTKWSLENGINWDVADTTLLTDDVALVFIVAAIQRAIIERDYGVTPF